jgi:hypothetical protein
MTAHRCTMDVPSGRTGVPGASDPRDTAIAAGRVIFKELPMSEVIQAEALSNLLDRKKIISEHVLPEEITAVQASTGHTK